MLKNIPTIIPPELMKVMMEMGHSDELVIADGNFPAYVHPDRVIRLDGHGVPEILNAVLSLMPLDTYVDAPVSLMSLVPGETYVPEIWKTYDDIIENHVGDVSKESLERFTFYDRVKDSFALIVTSETALYANIILKKGVVV